MSFGANMGLPMPAGKRSLSNRLMKFVSVKLFVFLVLAFLLYLGRDIDTLAMVAIALFAVRGVQYWLHYQQNKVQLK